MLYNLNTVLEVNMVRRAESNLQASKMHHGRNNQTSGIQLSKVLSTIVQLLGAPTLF